MLGRAATRVHPESKVPWAEYASKEKLLRDCTMTEDGTHKADWAQYQMFVLEELKRLSHQSDMTRRDIQDLIREFENMKGRSFVWAGLASIITAAGVSSLFRWGMK